MLLLGTFLITGIFGTILTFQLDYAPMYVWPVNLLFWHVEAGVVMTFISLFHMAWHFKYYRGILKNARAKWRLLRDTQKESDLAEGRLVLEAREARRAEREVRKAGCEPAPLPLHPIPFPNPAALRPRARRLLRSGVNSPDESPLPAACAV